MSCVVGCVDRETGNIYIGGDSAGVMIETLSSRIYEDAKVFFNGEVLFGVVGSIRVCQILRYIFNVPEQPEELKDDYKYICSIFIKELRACLVDNEYYQVQNQGEVEFNGAFMIGYKNNLYTIEGDMSVKKVNDFDAIGSGAELALASFYTLEKIMPELESSVKILTSLGTSGEFSMCVRPPYTYKILEKKNI